MSVGQDRITYSDDDEEHDHLLQNVKLMEPDSGGDDDGGNKVYNVHCSQVPLFATVRSPTNLLRSETGLPPGKGSDGERRNGGRPLPATSPCSQQHSDLKRQIHNKALVISAADN